MERHWGEKQKQSPKINGDANEKHISVQDNKIYAYTPVTQEA